jgi:hypothetical protein
MRNSCRGAPGTWRPTSPLWAANPILVSLVGEDSDGERLLGNSARSGRGRVFGSWRTLPAPPSLKTRVLAGHQQVVRFDRENRSPFPSAGGPPVGQCPRERLPRPRGCPFGLRKRDGERAPLEKCFGVGPPARETRDGGSQNRTFLQVSGVDCITPNLKEATEGVRAFRPKPMRRWTIWANGFCDVFGAIRF